MQVFKTYFKVLKRGALGPLLVNLAVVIVMCSIFSVSNFKEDNTFVASKTNMAVFNNDNSEFSDILCENFKQNCKIVKIDNTENAKKKALYYEDIDIVVTVPQGFGEKYLSGEDVKLDTQCNPSKTTSSYADMWISKYLSIFKLYNQTTDLSLKQIDENVNKDMSQQTDVVLRNSTSRSHLSSKSMFYNFSNYPLCVLLICSIGLITISFKGKDLNRRINCSSTKMSKVNFQMILGHLSVTVIMMLIVMILGITMFKVDITSPDGYLHYLNIFVFSIVALALSYLIANVANARSINPIANVITLGTCFLGGSFVPQEFLADGIKYTSVINPVWWFVKANNTISSVTKYSFENLKSAYVSMGIELLFAVVLFLATMYIIKHKRTTD